MRLRELLFLFFIFLTSTLKSQNAYFYSYIDSIIVPDSSIYGNTLNIDIDNDSINDMTISYIYISESDTVVMEDTILYYEDTMDVSSITFDNDSLAFIIPEIGVEFTDSTFNIISQDSFEQIDSSSYWTVDLAQAYNLFFGKKIIDNHGINYTGANFKKGLSYFGFKIYKTIDGTEDWYYGWLRLEHRDAYLRLLDIYLSKTAEIPIKIGQL